MKEKQVKPKRPPRTLKEKAWAEAYIKTGVATKAALMAYDTTSIDSAKRIGHENSTKLNIVELMEKRADLKLENRLNKLAEGLNSTITDKELPDYANRYKYLALSFQLDGSLNKQGDTQGTGTTNIQIINYNS